MPPWVAETHFRDNCCPNCVTVATSDHCHGCKPRWGGGKEKKPFYYCFFFYLVSVTRQSSFKCEFLSLKFNVLSCIINLVFCIPLICFLCKCLKSTQVYWVALNAFYKETLNNTHAKKAFLLPRNSGYWHLSAWRKMLCFSSTSNILTCYWYFSFFYYCYTAHKEMNFCFKWVFE